MRILLDTNVPSRLADKGHPHHAIARAAVYALRMRGDEMVLVPQVLYEFWVVCTRPADQNGLGVSTREAHKKLHEARALFPCLRERKDVLAIWEHLVVAYDVKGKHAHDARLVEAMRVHGLEAILTLNAADFARYPGIEVLDAHGFGAPAASRT